MNRQVMLHRFGAAELLDNKSTGPKLEAQAIASLGRTCAPSQEKRFASRQKYKHLICNERKGKMANEDSSASWEFDGFESGWVEARTSCDHLGSHVSSDLSQIPPPDSSCTRCDHPSENWLCLSCRDLLCGRFINKHMLRHYQETGHCIALSYSDLSVWCFRCDAYLDAQVIPQLRSVHEVVYLLKFGERPPLPALRLGETKAEGSASSS